MKAKQYFWLALSLLLVFALALGACSPQATPAPTEEAPQPAPTEVPKAEEPAAPAEDVPAGGEMEIPPAGQELTDAYAGKFSGTVVTMAGPFTDNDAVKFDESIKAFEEATGIDIQYEGSKEFEASITIKVDGGSPPDIVDFPQPGLLANMVKKGQVVDLNTVIDPAWLQQNYSQALVGNGHDGRP